MSDQGFIETSMGTWVDTGPEWVPTPYTDVPGDQDDRNRKAINAERKTPVVITTQEQVGKWNGSTAAVARRSGEILPDGERRWFEVTNFGPDVIRIAPYPAEFDSGTGIRVPVGATRRLAARGAVYAASQGDAGASVDVVEGL